MRNLWSRKMNRHQCGYLFSLRVHVPHRDASVGWARHQLPGELQVAQGLNTLAVGGKQVPCLSSLPYKNSTEVSTSQYTRFIQTFTKPSSATTFFRSKDPNLKRFSSVILGINPLVLLTNKRTGSATYLPPSWGKSLLILSLLKDGQI